MTRGRPIVISFPLFVLFSLYVADYPPRTRNILLHTSPAVMSITHTVLFQMKAYAEPEDVKAACDRFLALKDQCIHPTTNTPYLTSVKGGKDNSPEGMQSGITHGFVVEFNSAADRDYYVKTDPAHQAFIKSIDDLVEKAIVVDFSNGAY